MSMACACCVGCLWRTDARPVLHGGVWWRACGVRVARIAADLWYAIAARSVVTFSCCAASSVACVGGSWDAYKRATA